MAVQDALVAFYRGVADCYCDNSSPFTEGDPWQQFWIQGYLAVQNECSVKDIIGKAMLICDQHLSV
ncbi:MAG: hypothetical protein HOM11_14575 [Methylococcales bacterium]|jgi:hypothetical protein|nr:hypothetical protein [Methylococcales bacterium]MBT7445741.1 hypothetical protein [Methylococcales bacterium]